MLYKPVGPGSQSLLGAVRRAAGTRRVGHAGTLDPFASGVLPVAVGQAARLIDHLHSQPKVYRAVLRFGWRTTTGDLEGQVLNREPGRTPTGDELRAGLAHFVGELEQTPPAYSAARVGGRRAYELARAGEMPELPPRRVTVHSLSLLGQAGALATLGVVCSSGTYIRALAEDIAETLGTYAHLTSLLRTAVGPFQLSAAVTVHELERGAEILGFRRLLYPPDVVLESLRAITLSEEESTQFAHGQMLRLDSVPDTTIDLRVYHPEGLLLGLGQMRGGTLAPRVVLK